MTYAEGLIFAVGDKSAIAIRRVATLHQKFQSDVVGCQKFEVLHQSRGLVKADSLARTLQIKQSMFYCTGTFSFLLLLLLLLLLLFILLSVCLFQFIYLFIFRLSIFASICLSIDLCTNLSICLSIADRQSRP